MIQHRKTLNCRRQTDSIMNFCRRHTSFSQYLFVGGYASFTAIDHGNNQGQQLEAFLSYGGSRQRRHAQACLRIFGSHTSGSDFEINPRNL